MPARNSTENYGWVARSLHWGMAVSIIAMFGLGVWMRTLGYYDPWYKIGPDVHKSVGVILTILLALRFVWAQINPKPSDDHLKPHERVIARVMHGLLYAWLLSLMVAGYLISTADGRSIEVFGLFAVPSIIQHQAMPDIAGFIHEYMAYALMAMVVLHAGAALKHHVVDRDQTLRRMIADAPRSASGLGR